jgi:drug/metabolite transporter (DMT)-like permease
MELWIGFTLVAVVMQSVRTAGQKQIAGSISIQATTLVRFLFGLPFAVAYFLFLKSTYQLEVIDPDWAFFRSASLAAVSQIFATVFLVKALMVRNFAVGTALAKTEAILTAIIGAWFFSATLSFVAYLAVAVGVLGVLVASNWKITLQDLADNKSIKYGIGAGVGFALASLWIRDASLGLELPLLLSAATVLIYMVALQTVICLLWIAIKERNQFKLIAQNILPAVFIGFTSVAGSVGWFTAMSLQNAAIVKTLGQTEFVLTLLITYLYFGERISGREYAGMALVGASVLLLLTTSV